MPDLGQGTVYLICFDAPYRHARHYLGWAKDLDARLGHHRNGTGANLLRVVNRANVGWAVVRTWPGGRDLEARLKRRGGRSRLCPSCCSRGRGEAGLDQPGEAA